MQGVIHVAVIANYPVFGCDGKNTAKPSCFYRSILSALCNMLLKYCFGIGSFSGCFQGFFLWYHGTKAGNRYYNIRISAYPDTGRHISLILLMLMLASLSISRIVALIPWSSASMPLGSMPDNCEKLLASTSRLCHMCELWQVARTKPQVLRYFIQL